MLPRHPHRTVRPISVLSTFVLLAAVAVAGFSRPAAAATTPTFRGFAVQSSSTPGPISDMASIHGSSPTGTITFNLYGPDNATCAGPPIFTSVKTVSGNGLYSSDWYTPTAPGRYQWVAVYSGDMNNTPAATLCSDPDQAVVVGGNRAAVAASPTTVSPGQALTVTWSGVQNPTSTDWIGLFAVGAPDSAVRAWRYTGGTPSGSTTLTVPWGTPPGNYEVRLFYNNSTVRLATSNVVSVT